MWDKKSQIFYFLFFFSPWWKLSSIIEYTPVRVCHNNIRSNTRASFFSFVWIACSDESLSTGLRVCIKKVNRTIWFHNDLKTLGNQHVRQLMYMHLVNALRRSSSFVLASFLMMVRFKQGYIWGFLEMSPTSSHHKMYLICGNLTCFRNGVLPHFGVSTFSVSWKLESADKFPVEFLISWLNWCLKAKQWS